MEKHTILLVDDEQNILHALERLLSAENYKVYTAISGKDALTILSQHPIELIISDQRMPLMTGSEFLCQAKLLYPDTIRIVLSGYDDFNALKDAINNGAIYQFLSKPWDEALLLQTIYDAFQIKDKEKTLIKEEEEKEILIDQLMQVDYLTNINNRFSFLKLFNTFIENAKKNNTLFSLVQIDIDNFSHINDSFGRGAGDQVLVAVANNLKKIFRDENKIARLGSDFFCFVLTDLGQPSDVEILLQPLVNKLKEPIIVKNKPIYITVSIGASVYPIHGDTSEQLMKYANIALHYSKKLGGDNYQIYSEKLHEPTQTELKLESDLHEAITKNQFEIFYQPVFSAETKRIAGMEALLRWHHPNLGLLLPNQFVSLCERTGLIIAVGEWTILNACEKIKKWRDSGYRDLHVAVNLSARQFNDKTLLHKITQVLKETQLPPECLIFEITESIIMENMKENIEILRKLNKLGVLVSLDDFGTGYSSLNYLKQLPISALKIDKSFINDIHLSNKSASLVAGIILMAKNMGLKVVAEGVEKQEQFDILKKQQCDFIQGNLFSKPVTAEECTLLLQKEL